MQGETNGTTAGVAISRSRILLIAVLVIGLGWVCYVHFTAPILPYDDAFITFRHVDHLFAGDGPVYNVGERVFGCSTPLYFAWLCLLKAIGRYRSLPALAVRANLIWYVLTAVLAAQLLRRMTRSDALAALGVALILFNRRLLAMSIGGMEPFLFMSIALAFLLVCHERRRPVLAGALLGLAILTRAEGVCLAPAFVLAYPRPRDWMKGAIPAAILMSLWIVPAWLYFGSPLPHSMKAKATPIYDLPAFYSGVQVMKVLSVDLLCRLPIPFAGLIPGCIILLIIVAAAALRLRRRDDDRASHWGLAIFLLGAIALYTVGNALLMEWYSPLLIVSAMILLLLSADTFWGQLPEHWRQTMAAQVIIGVMGLAWVACDVLVPQISGSFRFLTPAQTVLGDPVRVRILSYVTAAQWLNDHAAPGDAATNPEIGAFGYYFHGKVLDPLGLVSAEALPFLPLPLYEQPDPSMGIISLEFVQATQPQWVVSLPCFSENSLVHARWFIDHYERVESIPLPMTLWGSHAVMIYRRR